MYHTFRDFQDEDNDLFERYRLDWLVQWSIAHNPRKAAEMLRMNSSERDQAPLIEEDADIAFLMTDPWFHTEPEIDEDTQAFLVAAMAGDM